ncbi:Rpn family recombination-promoting nuclease/putative transposase [Tumidithrix elongata RA019]|uniref:Rpn family recombination-promoting nuclease/putative transposase n=1 Tax=Tumidithrix elongata BACA0141 TaxID=2716417 RepID=A0AAW9Q1H7_9CYAN|nr:Rpn family recombination-promoting nuclease/putative transposase [Tumidithrix elongata RA019]
MKTDTLFYQLFQTFHSLLFELLDRPSSEAEGYQFSSIEIKEKAFRTDGVFIPSTDDKLIYFAEVQFQLNDDFYLDFEAEIRLYLKQYRPKQDWKAVAIFARSNCEPEPPKHCQEAIALGRIVRVYLEDWLEQETNSLGIAIIQLILSSEKIAPKMAKALAAKVEQETDADLQDRVVKFIETVLVYKFPKLTRTEIEKMFTHSDLKKTRVYQEALKEGEQLGEQRGLQLGKQEGLQLGEQRGLQRQVAMLLRMLTRKFGKVDPKVKTRISKLSAVQLENLAEAIFDFETIADLNAWLKTRS